MAQNDPRDPALDYGDNLDSTTLDPDPTPSPKEPTPPAEDSTDALKAEQPEATEPPEPKNDDAGRDDKGRFIPRTRYNELSQRSKARMEAAEARIRELEDQVARSETFNLKEVDDTLDKLEDQYQKLIQDGQTAEAKRLRVEMREIERRYTMVVASQVGTRAREDAFQEFKLDQVISALETDFPFLNPEDPSFAEEISTEIMDVYEGLTRKGYQKHVAMSRAAQYVLNSYEFESTDSAAPPKADATPSPDAVARGLKTADRQPPARTDGMGKTGRSLNSQRTAQEITGLKTSEFDKISDEELSRLRGDSV